VEGIAVHDGTDGSKLRRGVRIRNKALEYVFLSCFSTPNLRKPYKKSLIARESVDYRSLLARK